MPKRRARRERINRWLWALIDVAIWMGAIASAVWLRYELQAGHVLTHSVLSLAILAALIHVLAGAVVGPYAVGHERASFEETRDVGRTVTITGVVLIGLIFQPYFLNDVPRSVPFTATAFAMLGMFSTRFIIRSWRSRRAEAIADEKKAIVFGAGEAGRRLTRSLIRDVDSGFHPVAMLDDDRAKARLRHEGVKVRGTRTDIAAVADKYDATVLIIALPFAEASTIREVTELAAEAGLDVMVLPKIGEIIGGRPTAERPARRQRRRPARPPPGRARHGRDRRADRRASGSSSPARAAPSAPSCAARSPASARRSSTCSTATSPVSRPPR